MITSDFGSLNISEKLRETLTIEKKIKQLTTILLQLHTNYEILKHFNNTSDFNDFMLQTLKNANKLLSIDCMILFLYENNSLKIMTCISDEIDIKDGRFNIIIDKNLAIWDVFERRKTYLINNFNNEKDKFYGKNIKFNANINSMLALPLLAKDGRPIGVLAIHSKEKNLFNETSLPFYKELAMETAKTLERARQFSLLKELTFLDELTGLYNRRFLYAILEKEIEKAKRYGSIFSLVIADMNNFKKINDNFGHLKGDEILKKVANIIKSRLRASDIAVRYGGDEFAIILFEADLNKAEYVMNKVNKLLISTDFGFDFNVSLSFGVACFPDSATNKIDLIEFADKKLYEQKNKN